MKRKIFSWMLILTLIIGLLPGIEMHASETVNQTKTIYVDNEKGNDAYSGTESSPVKSLNRAIAMFAEGETGNVCIMGNVFADDANNDDAPLVISSNLTIVGAQGVVPTITVKAGGIILGADVTFENVKIGTAGFLRPGIAANGHKLTLNNVQSDTSLRPLQIYGGTFFDAVTGENFGKDVCGNKSEIYICGGSYENVYAGSVNGSVDIPVDIEVSKGDSLSLNGIYAESTSKNPQDESQAGQLPCRDASYTLNANVNIKVGDNAPVKEIDGGKEEQTVLLSTTGTGVYSYFVADIDFLTVESGTLLLHEDSNITNVELKGTVQNKATIDFSNMKKDVSVGDFCGSEHGILVVPNDYAFEITGTLSGGPTDFRVSGGMPWNSEEYPGYSGWMNYETQYIHSQKGEGSFVIASPYPGQEEIAFDENSSALTGWTTTEGSAFMPPTLLDFSVESMTVDASENYIEMTIDAQFAEDVEEYDRDMGILPLNYQVTYTAPDGSVAEYIEQSAKQDDLGYFYCDYLKATEDSTTSDVLFRFEPIQDKLYIDGELEQGVYHIMITAPTPEGAINREVFLNVTEDGEAQPDISFEMEWSDFYYEESNEEPVASGEAIVRLVSSKLGLIPSGQLQYTFYDAKNHDVTIQMEKVDLVAGEAKLNLNQMAPDYLQCMEITYIPDETSFFTEKVIEYGMYEICAKEINAINGIKSESLYFPVGYPITIDVGIREGEQFVNVTFGGEIGTVTPSDIDGSNNRIRFTMPAGRVLMTAVWQHQHTGGTANCKDAAICEGCGEAYGKTDPDNHTGETEVRNAKEATELETGYSGDIYCKGCGNLVEEGVVTDRLPLTRYQITYELNGGTNHKSNPEEYTLESVTIILQAPSKKGYTFGGWYTDANFKNKVTSIAKGSTGNKTFYAKWTINKYTITYNLNGGKNHTSNKASYYITTATFKLNNPTRKGYTFKGWYSDSKFTKKVTEIAKGSTGNKTLYAKWGINKYTITYKLNGGKNHKSNKASYYVTTATFKLNNPTRKGYTFKGWYSDSKYKTKVTQIKAGTTGNKTFYAKWAKTKYTIAYKLNGGKNHKSNKASYYVTTATFKLNNPTRTGYTFKGWYSDSKYKTKVSQIKAGTTGNKTLYAKWAKTKYTVKYVLNGGKNSSKNPSSYYVTTATVTLKNPTRKGYTFKGWYSDKACKKKVTQIKKGSTGSKTFYAKWVKKK